MARIEEITIDTLQRGDSSVLPWQLLRQVDEETTEPFDLTGYKAALTVSKHQWTESINDTEPDVSGRSAAKGFGDQYAIVDVDCDSTSDMHGQDPQDGKILFDLHKQNMWVEPGEYYCDIVLENKTNHRTHTYAIGKITIQGHPTNRLTTDAPDSYSDVTDAEDV